MIYLYAITEAIERPFEALCGVDFAPLSYLHQGRLTAVVSRVSSPVLAPTPRRLWQHEQVVEAVMNRNPVLPARFSTIVTDEATVSSRMEDLNPVLVEDLERLRGCVELSLRVIRLWDPVVSGDGMPADTCPELIATEKTGRTFDVARRAAEAQRLVNRRRNESLGELVNRSLAACALDHRMEVEEGAGVVIKAAYLVEKSRLGMMQKAVRRLMKTYPNLHFLCTGPWPPYHFVQPIEPVDAMQF